MEHAIYLQSLKTVLKSKGVTYAELAKQLKMSESGIKKMLNSKDLSFRRFFQICEILHVQPGQVLLAAEQKSIPTCELSSQQQDLLLSNRSLLAVYWRMTVENLTVDETRKLQNLGSAEIQKLLRKLVTARLLDERDGKFYAQTSGKFRWPDNSKIARHLNQEWSQLTLQRALHPKGKSSPHHRLMALRLSAQSMENLMIKLNELLDETVRISEREEMMMPLKNLNRLSVLTAVVPKGVLDPED